MTNGTNIKTTDYLDASASLSTGSFQYNEQVLEFFPHAEGYVKATNFSLGGNPNYAFNYVYNYTDHLGNVRLSYAKDPQTGNLKILDESHYYPFGLKHQEYQASSFTTNPIQGVIIAPVANNPFKYKYNGKEFQDELGLGLYDYGARNYDPALGRWSVIDPLAEMYPDISPYAYAANTPTMFVDYDGRHFGVEIDHEKKKITITGHFYANKEDMKLLNEIATYLNDQTGFVMKVGEGEEAEAYSIGFNITTEESSNPSKSAREANNNDKEGAMYNSFVQDSNDVLLRSKDSRRGAAVQTKAAIRDGEGVFAGAHEALHLLGSGHKDGIMKDSSTSGGLTAGVYGAILSGVGIGNGSIGTGNKDAIGWGHIRNEKGSRPVGFTGGTIMNRATFDRQMQRAVNKRERQERKEQRRGN